MNYFFWKSGTFLKHNICLILQSVGELRDYIPGRRLVFQLPRIFYLRIFQGSVITKIWWERERGERGEQSAGWAEALGIRLGSSFVSEEPKSNSLHFGESVLRGDAVHSEQISAVGRRALWEASFFYFSGAGVSSPVCTSHPSAWNINEAEINF